MGQEKNKTENNNTTLMFVLFVWYDSLIPSQQFFSHVIMGLPGLNQYSRIQGSASREARTHNPLILSQHSTTATILIEIQFNEGLNNYFKCKTILQKF